jgi:hypothetical protein
LPGLVDLGQHAPVFPRRADDRLQLGLFLGEFRHARVIDDDRRIGQQPLDLVIAVENARHFL